VLPTHVVCSVLLQSFLQSLLWCYRSQYMCCLCVEQCIAVVPATWRAAQLVVASGSLRTAKQPGVRPRIRQQHH
jgi:hypothetical protein